MAITKTMAGTIVIKSFNRNAKKANLLDSQRYSRKPTHSINNPPRLDSFKFSRGEKHDEK